MTPLRLLSGSSPALQVIPPAQLVRSRSVSPVRVRSGVRPVRTGVREQRACAHACARTLGRGRRTGLAGPDLYVGTQRARGCVMGTGGQPRMTRAERAARNRAAWAEASERMRRDVDAAAVPLSADTDARRQARRARRQARAARDSSWRATVAQAAQADRADTARTSARRPSSTSGSSSRSSTSAQRRQVAAVEAGITATWEQTRTTREERRRANQAAWAQLQLTRLAQTEPVRTGRRGERRRARSRAWRAAQSARLQSALPAGLQSAVQHVPQSGRQTGADA